MGYSQGAIIRASLISGPLVSNNATAAAPTGASTAGPVTTGLPVKLGSAGATVVVVGLCFWFHRPIKH